MTGVEKDCLFNNKVFWRTINSVDLFWEAQCGAAY